MIHERINNKCILHRLLLIVPLLLTNTLFAEEVKWQAEFNRNIILLPFADLIIPIQTAPPELSLHHGNLGYFRYSDGMVRSATRLPVVIAEQSGVTFSYRPTLFISIHGFDDLGFYETHYWQNNLQQNYIAPHATSSNSKHSQYVHFSVVWDSHRANQPQLEDLASMVNHFLATRSYPWDVVVLGHSRGGVFAHHFANKIINNAKLNRLHTILLDPTGVPALGDFFPVQLYTGSRSHLGSYYYDGQPVSFPIISPLDPVTVGDSIGIDGYTNYGRYDFYYNSGVIHDYFAQVWVDNSNGFARALNDVWALKESGSFIADGDGNSRWDTVYLRADAINADFSVDYANGEISGQIVVNGITTDAAFFEIGPDRVYIASSNILGASQIVLQGDEAMFREDNGVVNTAAEITSDGIHVRVDVLGLVEGDLDVDLIDVLLGGGGSGLPGLPPLCPFC